MKKMRSDRSPTLGGVSRRRFLATTGLAAGLAAGKGMFGFGARAAPLPTSGQAAAGDILILVFLRGGADTLNMIVPHGDPGYYHLRRTLAVARPDDPAAPPGERAIDLDGFFGLHPALAPLVPLYAAGELLMVQSVGSPDESRSHFKTQDLMEGGYGLDFTGWLGRHLDSLDTGNPSALRAVAVGPAMQKSLIAPVQSDVYATVIQSIDAYRLYAGHEQEMEALMRAFVDADESALAVSGRQTLETIALLRDLAPPAEPPGGGLYPDDPYGFGSSLRDVATLIKADAGLEVAALDFGGWDLHEGLGAGGDPNGPFSRLLAALGGGLAALAEDLGARMDRVTLVVMTEFGRQLAENGSLGTDHGRGGPMLVLGGKVLGGQVFSSQPWEPLLSLQERGEIDLPVMTDYRDVLGEILRRRMNNDLLDYVFPEYVVTEHGLVLSG